ncbi:hypothetical protein ZORO111903_17015 [Zobellia roscoffensis]|uniref:hypothetical protein n=1 Tax=Zobellia roscoffensis TaxID=2779508 RepID=UPI00188BE142|nr:hypothetical protein [Zobellia roscoffensis]
MKTIFYFTLLLIFISCTMGPKDKFDKKEFEELQKNNGSENYEIQALFSKDFEVIKPLLNNKNGEINIFGKTNPLNKREIQYKRLKISIDGEVLEEGPTDAGSIKDGSMFGFDFYYNWIVNGDTTKHKFLDPFSLKRIENIYEFVAMETDPKIWMGKFEECYNQASHVVISQNNSNKYYLKIEDKWYFMENTLEGTPENLKDQYPEKEDQDLQMVDLRDLAPEYYHPQQGATDNNLIKMKEYESTFFEKENQGLNSYSYSAGWWYLEIYLPLGDTLRIKRYSNYEDPELQLYKIPTANGGREDVLFIIQKPEEMFPEQVGGMYVIRPRDMAQPERRYKSVSYGTRENGHEYIIKSQETTEYTEWSNNRKN